ncbi:MAG: hypothetical protein ACTHKL_04700 [Streptosporangiaceae bacterium]
MLIFIADLDVRILRCDVTLVRQLTRDPARNYQPIRPPGSP